MPLFYLTTRAFRASHCVPPPTHTLLLICPLRPLFASRTNTSCTYINQRTAYTQLRTASVPNVRLCCTPSPNVRSPSLLCGFPRPSNTAWGLFFTPRQTSTALYIAHARCFKQPTCFYCLLRGKAGGNGTRRQAHRLRVRNMVAVSPFITTHKTQVGKLRPFALNLNITLLYYWKTAVCYSQGGSILTKTSQPPPGPLSPLPPVKAALLSEQPVCHAPATPEHPHALPFCSFSVHHTYYWLYKNCRWDCIKEPGN